MCYYYLLLFYLEMSKDTMMDKLKILKNKGAGVFSSVLEKLHEMNVSNLDKIV